MDIGYHSGIVLPLIRHFTSGATLWPNGLCLGKQKIKLFGQMVKTDK